MENETVRAMTDGQRSDIIATMVTAMPTLNFDQAQAIIGNKGLFVADIGAAFKRNTGKPVSVAQAVTTQFTIGDRTYELVPFLKEGESWVSGDTMVERANKLDANLNGFECDFFLKNEDKIPSEYREKFYLIFTTYREASGVRSVACLGWSGGRWYLRWGWLASRWFEDGRLVRRRT